MRRFFSLLLLLCVLQIHAVEIDDAYHYEPDPLDEPFNSLDILSGEPSAIVHQCVNVITGDYIDISADLKLPGAEPLSLARFYSSSDLHCYEPMRAWKFNHDKVVYKPKPIPMSQHKSDLVLRDAFGAMLPFEQKLAKGRITEYLVHPKVFSKRVTNTSGEMSGKTHLKNKTLVHLKKERRIISRDGAGSTYCFQKTNSKTKYPLQHVRKPNGNQIRYDYDELNLKTITALNKGGRPFGQLDFTLTPLSESGNVVHLEVKGPGGCRATYKLSSYPFQDHQRWILNQAKPHEAPKETYTYDPKFKIIRKELPNQRFLNIDYYQAGHNAVWPNEDYFVKSVRTGRVMRLLSPAGIDATPVPIYRFLYYLDAHKEKGGPLDIRGGTTVVYDAYDRKTSYHFGSDERLHKVEYFEGTDPYQLYSQQRFYWGNAGNLKSKALMLSDGAAVFCQTYSYDPQGNVIGECLYGNLSGLCQDCLTIDESGKPQGSECLSIRKEYTKDGRNLVAYESHSTHPYDCRYEYHAGTNLLKAKYILDGTTVCKREFYDYDDNGAVTVEIIDDGSSFNRENLTGVTERHVKRISNTDSFPLGLPKIVEEKYCDLETGQEHLLKKWVNGYNAQGKLSTQTVYDSQHIQAYTLTWEYNALGKVIKETNALGQTLTRKYDDNGNKIFEQGFNMDLHHVYRYDYMNRLISEEEVWADGTCLEQKYEYDYLGNRLSNTDIHGCKTLYTYNDFSQPIKITFPAQVDEDGCIVNSTLEKQYDILGNVISLVDAKGATTAARYTIHGKPYMISYPNGSKELFEYTLKGQLVKKVSRSDTYTLYTTDYFARPTKEELYSSNGCLLKSMTRTYNAFHLMQETDPAGYTTHYRYDGAGRLIRMTKGSNRTDYVYDSLGRVQEKRRFSSNAEDGYIATAYVYDLLDRIIQETTLDSGGKIYRKTTYAYDEEGRCKEVICDNQAGTSSALTMYNPHGDPVATIDPLGQTTSIKHLYLQTNITETTDPLGRTTCIEKDALNRVVSTQIKNDSGKIVKKSTYRYDAAGNRRFCNETAWMPDGSEREVMTSWDYNESGRLIKQIEAVGTPEQKTTKFSYYPSGEVKAKVKPDGTRLNYYYDPCGRLERIVSSDGSIDYTYEYDLNDNLIRAHDQKNSTSTMREYDQQDRLIKETLAHGLSVAYDYDDSDRLVEVGLPDLSSIQHAYAGPDLHQVRRISPNGDVIYQHTYDRYDLAGNLTQASLIGQAGQANYIYDLLSRPIGLMTANYRESNEAFDPAGNLKIRTVQDPAGATTCSYGYDDLDQLTSADSANPQAFIYDSLSNPATRNTLPCRVNSLNQLTAIGNCTYRYDLNGNRIVKDTSGEEVIYEYDALDRLITVTDQTQKITYDYDYSHRRLAKTICSWNGTAWHPEQKILYLYQGSHEIGSYDSQGRNVELKVSGQSCFGTEIGAAVAIELQGEPYAPLSDRTGNIVSLIKSGDGNPYETYRYGPFGEEQIFDEAGNLVEEAMNPWRYASKRKDPETGFIYFGRRYYDPEIGRWLTADPAGFADGMNLYVFNHNNPLRYIDKDGRFAFAIPLLIFAFGTEAVITTTTVSAIAGAFVGAALAYGAYEGFKYLDQHINESSHDYALANQAVEEKEKKGKRREVNGEPKPPYSGQVLGEDPTKCPGEGFEWRGEGEPGKSKGAWHNAETTESLYPDLNHPKPMKPHWDYTRRDKQEGARLNTDGTWEWK